MVTELTRVHGGSNIELVGCRMSLSFPAGLQGEKKFEAECRTSESRQEEWCRLFSLQNMGEYWQGYCEKQNVRQSQRWQIPPSLVLMCQHIHATTLQRPFIILISMQVVHHNWEKFLTPPPPLNFISQEEIPKDVLAKAKPWWLQTSSSANWRGHVGPSTHFPYVEVCLTWIYRQKSHQGKTKSCPS